MLVTQSRPTLCYPMGWSPPGSSIHGILQAQILEWVAISFSRGIFPTQESNPGLLHWQADSLLSEPPGKPGAGQTSGHFSHLIYLIHLLHVNSYHCQHVPSRQEDWSLAQFQKVHWVSVSGQPLHTGEHRLEQWWLARGTPWVQILKSSLCPKAKEECKCCLWENIM